MDLSVEVNWITVLIISGITALATGLGVLPFVFVKHISKRYTAYGNALAAGLMLAASFRLINEGISYDLWKCFAGFIGGLILIHIINLKLADNHNLKIGNLSGASALKALIIVGVMTIHSFAEGIGVGVSFGDGRDFGIFVAIAIAVHNIPEGLAIAIVLIPRGVKVWKSGIWAVVSSLPQPLLAVPAFFFVMNFRQYLPAGLGLAGGAMIYMVNTELIPDALKDNKRENIGLVIALAVIIMMLFQIWMEVDNG